MKKSEWAKLAQADQGTWWTDRELRVIDLFYRRGWYIEDIAAEMYCSRSTVKRILCSIREKLSRK